MHTAGSCTLHTSNETIKLVYASTTQQSGNGTCQCVLHVLISLLACCPSCMYSIFDVTLHLSCMLYGCQAVTSCCWVLLHALTKLECMQEAPAYNIIFCTNCTCLHDAIRLILQSSWCEVLLTAASASAQLMPDKICSQRRHPNRS